MFNTFKRIFGIPAAPVAAGRVKSMASRPGMFLPESKIPPGGIEAVADDGSCWEPWLVDPATGEQWYRRLSSVEPIADSPVHGIASDEGDDSADDWDGSYATGQDDEGNPTYNVELIHRNIKARNLARQLASRSEILGDEGDDDGDE